MVRIYFKDKNIRNKFFKDLIRYSNLKTWKELRNKFDIPRTNLENYRNGKLTIPNNVYNNFNLFLPKKLIEHYSLKINSKEDRWGMIKGGKHNYIKNKHLYDLGRKKAWKVTRKKFGIEKIDVNAPINSEFCEVLGAFIGDGSLNIYRKNKYFVQFSGDSRYDLSYYKSRIIPLVKSLINRNPYIRIKKNSMWVTFYSKYLLKILTDRFSMPKGKKVYTVKIPDEILKDKTKLIFTLRGIFDTDGCVFFDKRNIYKKPYIRIALQLANKDLIEQVSDRLTFLKIPHTRYDRINVGSFGAYTIQINGIDNVKKYCETIGFYNQRHLKKLNFNFQKV